jgi:hypothetical protein
MQQLLGVAACGTDALGLVREGEKRGRGQGETWNGWGVVQR